MKKRHKAMVMFLAVFMLFNIVNWGIFTITGYDISTTSTNLQEYQSGFLIALFSGIFVYFGCEINENLNKREVFKKWKIQKS